MVRDNTRGSKRAAPIACALVAVVLLALVRAVLVVPLVGASYGDRVALVFLGVYALVVLAVIGGVLAALFQRLREIQGGEEEDAKQY